MGTVVQTEADVDRLMANTNDDVGLLLDTGHLVFAGGDPVAVARRHAARIVHVHCKDVRAAVLAAVLRDDRSFLRAVLDGVFTVPGDGGIDFTAVLRDSSGRTTAAGSSSKPSRTRPSRIRLRMRGWALRIFRGWRPTPDSPSRRANREPRTEIRMLQFCLVGAGFIGPFMQRTSPRIRRRGSPGSSTSMCPLAKNSRTSTMHARPLILIKRLPTPRSTRCSSARRRGRTPQSSSARHARARQCSAKNRSTSI
jgi:hypothetical protein